MTGHEGTQVPDGLIGEVAPLPRERLEADAREAAARLLGALLVRRFTAGEQAVARLVEVEAYREDDPASHSHRGRTGRTAPMFDRAGTAYVYRSYGIHWCANVSVEQPGTGAAVLLRAARPVVGLAAIRARRPGVRDIGLLRGPGNLAAGLGIDARQDGRDLLDAEGELVLASDGWQPPRDRIVAGPRVGVSVAADVPWRWHLAGVAEVSSYRRSPRAT